MGLGLFGCPAHDQRDLDFALKYKIPFKTVVKPLEEDDSYSVSNTAYTGPGEIFNSEFLNLKYQTSQLLKLLIFWKIKNLVKKKLTSD